MSDELCVKDPSGGVECRRGVGARQGLLRRLVCRDACGPAGPGQPLPLRLPVALHVSAAALHPVKDPGGRGETRDRVNRTPFKPSARLRCKS